MTKSWLMHGCAVMALFIGGVSGAQAQDVSDDTVIVTGTLIKGLSETGVLPVDVIGQEELAMFGNPSPVELLKNLPVSAGVLGDSNQVDSRGQLGEGLASVNLRGLGASRTLVLLNNKRLTSVPRAISLVDINLLPLSGVDRIEILKEGAASTYGSDAVAGVVNFITPKNQDGFKIGADYKFVDGSDGDYTLSGSFGKQFGAGGVFFSAGYQHRSELNARDRDFALQPYEVNPQGGWTGGGNPSTFLTAGFNPLTGPGVGINGGLRADADCENLGGFLTAQNRCATQYTEYFNLVEEENRFQLFGDVDFDISEDWTFNGSLLYAESDVPQTRTSPSFILSQGPSAASVAGNPLGGFSAIGFLVPGNNPGFLQYQAENPAEFPLNGFGPGNYLTAIFPTLLYRPFMAGGNPAFDNGLGSSEGERSSESIRGTASLSGSLNENIDFEASVVHHVYDRTSRGFDSFGDRVQLALQGFGGPNCDRTAGVAGANGCSWLNPFGNAVTGTGPSNDNPELIDWFFVESVTEGQSSLTVGEVVISGDTGFELSGGNVGFALGAQIRDNSVEFNYGPNNNLAVTPCRDTPITGNTNCNPETGALAFLGSNRDSQSSNDVYALFSELQLPVNDRLDVQLAARFEDYGGDIGSTFDPKVSARFQATDNLALRGSLATTFRGPLPQNASGQGVVSLQLVGSSFRAVETSSNTALKPEKSTNISLGGVFEGDNFTGSLDYFSYDLSDVIVTEPLSGMVGTLFAPGGCADPANAGLRERFLFADGGGVPGAGTCSIGNVSRVFNNIVNAAEVKTSGFDLIANYKGIETGLGEIGLGATATYVLDYNSGNLLVEDVVVQNAFDAAGQLNFQTSVFPIPELKGQFYVDLSRDLFDARFVVNYVGRYDDQRATLGTGPFAPNPTLTGSPVVSGGEKIDSFVTADLNVQLNLPADIQMALSVQNIFDQDPSFARLDYNYDPFTSNPLGRVFKVGFRKDF